MRYDCRPSDFPQLWLICRKFQLCYPVHIFAAENGALFYPQLLNKAQESNRADLYTQKYMFLPHCVSQYM